jgi:hypothetical protein
MNNSPYLCYVKMIDAAIRRQAPDENGGEIRSRLLFLRGFDIGQMLSKIQSRQSTIVKSTTVDGALRQLADIYNWKIQSGKIRFEVEGNKITDIFIR